MRVTSTTLSQWLDDDDDDGYDGYDGYGFDVDDDDDRADDDRAAVRDPSGDYE